MSKEFNLDKIYTKVLSKKELLKLIKRTFDKEFIVTFIPRTHDNADILIRSLEEQIKKSSKPSKKQGCGVKFEERGSFYFCGYPSSYKFCQECSSKPSEAKQ